MRINVCKAKQTYSKISIKSIILKNIDVVHFLFASTENIKAINMNCNANNKLERYGSLLEPYPTKGQ